ncbi:MAG: SDR family oxidoreductase, partial [Candidatus Solibacter sp.]|nr:SDR family oxidoreductase [Candidatus Solibacter sp.]
IGRAIAMRLASEGARVVLCARDTTDLHEVHGAIEAAGAASDVLPLDLRQPDAPARLAAFAIEQTGRIDLVVNNAGATRRGEFESLTDDDWTDGFALKFFGAMRLTRAAWPYLKQSRGAVLFISGIGGRTPGAQFAIGGSVNAALLSLTKSLADAGLRDGIRVNTINPGTIRTRRFQARLETLAREKGIDLATAESEFVHSAKVTRIGEPEDVAALAAFVLGPEGSLLHGAIIDLDAGATKTV